MSKFTNFFSTKPLLKKEALNAVYGLFRLHSLVYPQLKRRMFTYQPIAPFPRIVQTENINICNSKCVMCPYTLMTRKKGVMSEKLFKKVIDECITHREFRELWLYMYGEPLLDNTIFDRIAYAKKKGVQTVFLSTNASVLDAKKAKKLVESGLDSMVVSLDGAKKATYESLRVGLKFEDVKANIRRLIEIKRAMGKRTPKITLQIINMPDTKKDINPFIKEWKNLADRIAVVPCHDYAGQKKGKAIWKAGKEARLPCDYLWDNCTVLNDGKVTFCCMDYDAKLVIGDAAKDKLGTIWNSGKMQAIRKVHISGNFLKIPLCASCHVFLNNDKGRIARTYIRHIFRKI